MDWPARCSARADGAPRAGYTGALLYNNGEHATTFLSDVSRSVLRTLAKAPDAPSGGGGGGGAAADDALRRLTAEVRART